eukprot:8218344-Alexandrium_andersonii.AAC.1
MPRVTPTMPPARMTSSTSLAILTTCRRAPTLPLALAWGTPTWSGLRVAMARLPQTLTSRRLGGSSCAG